MPLIMLILFLMAPLFGSVNHSTGAWEMSFLDLIMPVAKKDFDLNRQYSTANLSYLGNFGVGWGSNLELDLEVGPESIKLTEYGNGRTFIFNKMGESWVTDSIGKQIITKTEKGFLRTWGNGDHQLISPQGQILEENKSGVIFKFIYQNDNLIRVKNENSLKELTISWNDQDLISSINLTPEIYAKYEYDKNKNLINVIYNGKNDQSFQYDQFSRMTSAQTNKSNDLITYDNKQNLVTSVKSKDGTQKDYKFDNYHKKGGVQSLTITTKEDDNTQSSAKFVFSREEKSNRIEKYEEYKNGALTKTLIYGNKQIEFPTRKITPGQDIKYEYDGTRIMKVEGIYASPTIITYVGDTYLPQKVVTGQYWTTFEYDKKMRVREIKNDNGRVATFTYGTDGLLKEISERANQDAEKRILKIFSNLDGRAAKIELYGVGHIESSYSKEGHFLKNFITTNDQIGQKIVDVINSVKIVAQPAGLNFEILP